MTEFHKADIEKLIDGVLPWPATQDMLKSPKDENRFDKYVEILQGRVGWDERILLPLTPALFIVAKVGQRIVKCRCGHEFTDYRINWKLESLIHVRDDEASIAEARSHAESEQVDGQITFEVRDATMLVSAERYDLACIYEALHDMAHPVEALRAECTRRRRRRRPGGCLVT